MLLLFSPPKVGKYCLFILVPSPGKPGCPEQDSSVQKQTTPDSQWLTSDICCSNRWRLWVGCSALVCGLAPGQMLAGTMCSLPSRLQAEGPRRLLLPRQRERAESWGTAHCMVLQPGAEWPQCLWELLLQGATHGLTAMARDREFSHRGGKWIVSNWWDSPGHCGQS